MINLRDLFITLPIIFLMVVAFNCGKSDAEKAGSSAYRDTSFFQEYHQGFKISASSEENNVRKIAVDKSYNVWIATAAGIFVKPADKSFWQPVIEDIARGPAFTVTVDNQSVVWMGTWDGVYRFRQGRLQKHQTIDCPISVICQASEGIYFLGPQGIWLESGGKCQKLDFPFAKSVKDAVSDNQGGLWIATKAGLYHYRPSEIRLFQNETDLISCYLTGLAGLADGKLWVGGLGGVTIRENRTVVNRLTPQDGLPSAFVNCVSASPDGVIWIGTDVGIVRFYQDGSHSLRFSKRWLMADKVNDVTFDPEGNAWIATTAGVSVIKRKKMTLSQKADYFYDILMKRHIRRPWIAGQVRLDTPGDTSTWRPMDDDNDGEYTAIYLSMESLRYAVTKEQDAREKAVKAFAFLKYLQTVTETDGFFARTIVPSDWPDMHDRNRVYTKKQIAEEMVKDPRFKPVAKRWHLSKDQKWLWKGDTSSDELCGHMLGYFYYYEFAADENERREITRHIQKIMDHLIVNDYNLIDVDGRHTRWGVWSPDKLNRKPDWSSERSLNAFELLAFLKLAHHVTGEEKYQAEYLRLIREENYLENAADLNHKNPAWFIYFDVSMAGYLFPILVKYETDPQLKKFYEGLIDEWFEEQRRDQSPFNNYIYCLARNKLVETEASIRFLIDAPLDLVDWRIDHTLREDIRIVREPTLEEFQTAQLVPPSMRATVRWDRNPWAAVNGNPDTEREPVFWLFPYWLGRYIGAIIP